MSKYYKDYGDCPYCQVETECLCFDSGHERDSSNDWRQCLNCGSWNSGMGDSWDKPPKRWGDIDRLSRLSLLPTAKAFEAPAEVTDDPDPGSPFTVDKLGRPPHDFYVVRGMAFAFSPQFQDIQQAERLALFLNSAWRAYYTGSGTAMPSLPATYEEA